MEPVPITRPTRNGKVEAMGGLQTPHGRQPRARRGLALFARALLLRCPACGQAPAMVSWFRMHERCPHCSFALERGEGYRSGAMAANLVGTELVLTLLLLIGGIVTWPAVPWDWFWGVGIVAAAVLPLAFYPLSRTLWVAMDLTFHPAEAADFASGVRSTA
jgi:hypothetical protein